MDRKSLLAIFHLYGTLRDGGREALQSALRGLGSPTGRPEDGSLEEAPSVATWLNLVTTLRADAVDKYDMALREVLGGENMYYLLDASRVVSTLKDRDWDNELMLAGVSPAHVRTVALAVTKYQEYSVGDTEAKPVSQSIMVQNVSKGRTASATTSADVEAQVVDALKSLRKVIHKRDKVDPQGTRLAAVVNDALSHIILAAGHPDLLSHVSTKLGAMYWASTLRGPQLQQWVVVTRMVANLDGGAYALLQARVDEGLVNALSLNGENPEVVDQVCAVFWELASVPDCQFDIPTIVYRSVREVLVVHAEAGLPCLLKVVALLARSEDRAKALMLVAGPGCAALARAVRHAAAAGEQELTADALRAVWDLANGNATVTRQLAEQEVVKDILAALDKHFTKTGADVWQQGVGALWALTADQPEIKTSVVTAGGVDRVIVRGLKTFRQQCHAGLVEALLGLVSNLASESGEVRQALGDQGVPALVVEVLSHVPRAAPAKVAYIMHFFSATVALATEHPANRAALAPKACKMLKQVLMGKLLQTAAGVDPLHLQWMLEPACLMIHNLATTPQPSPSFALLTSEPVVAAAAKLLSLPPAQLEYPPFWEAVLLALHGLITSEGVATASTCKALQAAGLPSALVAVLRLPEVAGSADVFVAALRLLTHLVDLDGADGRADMCQAFHQLEVCDALAAALSVALDKPCGEAVTLACHAASRLAAYAPEHAGTLARLHFEQKLVLVLKRATAEPGAARGTGGIDAGPDSELVVHAGSCMVALLGFGVEGEAGEGMCKGLVEEGVVDAVHALLRCPAVKASDRCIHVLALLLKLLWPSQQAALTAANVLTILGDVVAAAKSRGTQPAESSAEVFEPITSWLEAVTVAS